MPTAVVLALEENSLKRSNGYFQERKKEKTKQEVGDYQFKK